VLERPGLPRAPRRLPAVAYTSTAKSYLDGVTSAEIHQNVGNLAEKGELAEAPVGTAQDALRQARALVDPHAAVPIFILCASFIWGLNPHHKAWADTLLFWAGLRSVALPSRLQVG
jgi:hypothetical protein